MARVHMMEQNARGNIGHLTNTAWSESCADTFKFAR